MRCWSEEVAQLQSLLAEVEFTDAQAVRLEPDEGFLRWRRWTEELRQRRQTIYLIGNGASASMASHYAADLAKNAHLHTQVFSDLSLITAISNDIGYSQVFAEPLRRRAQAQDMLVCISSSGRSENILAAAQLARDLALTVVTLSAMDAGNPLRALGQLNLHVGARSYGLAETCHAALLHHWMDLVEVPH